MKSTKLLATTAIVSTLFLAASVFANEPAAGHGAPTTAVKAQEATGHGAENLTTPVNAQAGAPVVQGATPAGEAGGKGAAGLDGGSNKLLKKVAEEKAAPHDEMKGEAKGEMKGDMMKKMPKEEIDPAVREEIEAYRKKVEGLNEQRKALYEALSPKAKEQIEKHREMRKEKYKSKMEGAK